MAIAKKNLDFIKRKQEANVAEQADVLRAEDDFTTALQNQDKILSQLKGVRQEAAALAKEQSLLTASPKFDLYRTVSLVPIAQAEKTLVEDGRTLKALRLVEQRTTKELSGSREEARHQLNLELGGGFRRSDEEYDGGGSATEPEAFVGLSYSYPLGNTKAASDTARLRLEREQRLEDVKSMETNLIAELRNVRTQIDSLIPVLALNRKQIKTAAERTREERSLYNRGRGELNFVLQAEDRERNARLFLC